MSEQKKSGPPVEYPMPEPIPDTPENIAHAIVTTPPKTRKDWRYVRDREGDGDE